MTDNAEAKEKPRVKVFTASHCEPCQEIKGMLENGQFTVDGEEGEVDVVDIETEEGFEEATKRDDLAGVPCAFKGAKQCKIMIDEEAKLIRLECEDNGELSEASDSKEPS